jgi:uncharacterized DUF497 family protein
MRRIRFIWDDKKSKQNYKKHGIDFEEAKTVFYDENAVEFYDEEHSDFEDRFILLGNSIMGRILVVCHCLRGKGNIIRIINARKATKNERKHYPWR